MALTPQLVAFGLFTLLTLVFAFALLQRLTSRPAQPQANLATESENVKNVAAMGGGSDELKAIADAVSTILKSLSDFGAKLDTFGPIAILGIFTVIFALLTVACAWMTRS